MNLHDIYKAEKFAGLKRIATATGANPKFLWQCATGRRSLSPMMAERLCAADPRLTLEDIRGAAVCARLSLKDLYDLEGTPGLIALAKKVGSSAEYLRQCALGPKMPSPAMAWRLCDADPRLEFAELFAAARPKGRRKAS